MKKLFRIITAIIFTITGAGIVFFNASALLGGADWVMAIAYGSLIVIGLAFIAIGWAVFKGEGIKEILQDLLSGISF